MAIVWARPKNTKTFNLDEGGKQHFREEFTVKSDSSNESRFVIFGASGVPAYGTRKAGTDAVCRKVTADRNKENPYLWDVVAEWNTVTAGQQNPEEEQKQPDQRRAKWRFKFTPLPQAFFADLDGVPFTDTAGTPFDPPPNIPLYVDEVTIQRYEATCDRTVDRGYMNFTNTDTWNGAAANTALIADIDAEEVYEYGAYWFAYTYRILVNPRYTVTAYGKDRDGNSITTVGGWNPHLVLNAGTREWSGGTVGPVVRNEYADGRTYPLNASGVAMLPSAIGNYGVNNSELVYLKFRLVGECAFSALNLVPPWE